MDYDSALGLCFHPLHLLRLFIKNAGNSCPGNDRAQSVSLRWLTHKNEDVARIMITAVLRSWNTLPAQ